MPSEELYLQDKIHTVFENNILSDHIKQIADFNINGETIRIVTHNMLNRCTNGEWPDNAWNIGESNEQYQLRLHLLAEGYRKDIINGASIIGLQEAPRDHIARKFFQFMNLDSSWKYEVRNTGDTDEQALMFIYNESVTGEIKAVTELLEQRANSYSFTIQGLDVQFINLHASYGATFDNNLAATTVKMQELMSTNGKEIKIRFGDHNGNSNRYKDLLVWQDKLPTSVAYDIENKDFSFIDNRDGNIYKNYDGFAVSENYLKDGHSYKLYPSQVIMPHASKNNKLSLTPVPKITNLDRAMSASISMVDKIINEEKAAISITS